MINSDLMQRVLKQIEEHPETWFQSCWVNECGTVACFAGWACLLAGHSPQEMEPWAGDDVGDEAERLLGLDEEDGDRLFAGENTLDDLRHLVNEFTQRVEMAD